MPRWLNEWPAERKMKKTVKFMKKLSTYITAPEKGIIREKVDFRNTSLKHKGTILSTLL